MNKPKPIRLKSLRRRDENVRQLISRFWNREAELVTDSNLVGASAVKSKSNVDVENNVRQLLSRFVLKGKENNA